MMWLRGSCRVLRARNCINIHAAASVVHPSSVLLSETHAALFTTIADNQPLSCIPCHHPRRWAHQHVQHEHATSTTTPCSCWRCGMQSSCPKSEDAKFCGSCGAIQPVTTTDYFAVMGIKPTFDVDVSALERTYKSMQRRLHPDKFSTSSHPEERAHSENQAALVNQAYSTLRTPLSRARYLLEQQGMAPAEGLTVDDPAFLMEAMEARQAAEDTDDPRVLRTMLDENAETQRGIEKELSAACAGGRWEEAQQLVWRLTYVVRVAEAIVDKL